MPTGVLLALLSYSIYAVGDAITKSFTGSALSVFEITFIINLFTLAALPFARQPGERWADLVSFGRPVLMHARAILYTASTFCFVFAVTTIPLAETYSLAFLAPIFLTLLSLWVLKEKVAALRWVLIIISFIGVLIVVRPGFRELGIGHLAAIGVALFSAGSNVVLRIVSTSERQSSIIAVNGAYQVIASAILIALTHFAWPSPTEFILLAAVGLLGGGAQMLLIRAMQRAPASHIGPSLYVQILWAIVLGALFFHESQDLTGYVGLAILVIAGVAVIFSDGAQARISGRWAEYRARRDEPKINRIEGPEI